MMAVWQALLAYLIICGQAQLGMSNGWGLWSPPRDTWPPQGVGCTKCVCYEDVSPPLREQVGTGCEHNHHLIMSQENDGPLFSHIAFLLL